MAVVRGVVRIEETNRKLPVDLSIKERQKAG